MDQIIYADILFAVNFSMDFLALYIMSFILKLSFSIKRGIIAAGIGAVYGVVTVAFDSLDPENLAMLVAQSSKS